MHPSSRDRIHFSPSLGAAVCRAATRHSGQAERMANTLVGFALAVLFIALGVWLLLSFSTPCAAGHLCLAAVVKVNRSPWHKLHQVLGAPLQRAYLRMRIREAQKDLRGLQHDLTLARMDVCGLPPQIRVVQTCVEAWQADLDSLALDRRAQ